MMMVALWFSCPLLLLRLLLRLPLCRLRRRPRLPLRLLLLHGSPCRLRAALVLV